MRRVYKTIWSTVYSETFDFTEVLLGRPVLYSSLVLGPDPDPTPEGDYTSHHGFYLLSYRSGVLVWYPVF